MAANDSGGNGRDPWQRGSGGGNEGPPDLMELLRKWSNKVNKKQGGSSDKKDSNRGLIILGAVVAVVLWALSGIFLVSPAEQSVVLRFGQYVKTVGPGPHWIPRFIESQYTQNIQRIDSFPYESEMLTKDENIVSVGVQVQYRVDNVRDFLFNVVDPVTTLHQAISSALRQVVGQMELDAILTTGREQLTRDVTEQLNQTLAEYKTGIQVRDVALQSTKPPEAVTDAFDDVVKAREDRQRYINQAQAYAKRVVLNAQGQAARIGQQANAYEYSVVAHAKGTTARYLALLTPYLQAPEVTRERLYLDTISQVLSKTSNVVVDSSGGNVFYLPLDQLVKRAVAANESNASTQQPQINTSPLPPLQSAGQTASNSSQTVPSYSTSGGSY